MPPRRISPEEWDLYKQDIFELSPNLTTSALLERLSRDHGFCPTESQLERQKKKWKLKKYKSREDWQHINEQFVKRDSQSKNSEIIVHNQLVTRKQLRRARKHHTRQKPISIPSMAPSQDSHRNPQSGITVTTPPAMVELATNKSAEEHSSQSQRARDAEAPVALHDFLQHLANPDSQHLYQKLYSIISNFTFYKSSHPRGRQVSIYEESLQWEAERNSSHDFSNLAKLHPPTQNEKDYFSFGSGKYSTSGNETSIAETASGEQDCDRQLGRRYIEKAFRAVLRAIYLSSNNTLSASQADQLLQFVERFSLLTIVYGVISQHTPLSNIFASKLLFSSIKLKRMDITVQLLRHGACPNMKAYIDGRWTSPLYEAVSSMDDPVLQILVKHGGKVDLALPGRNTLLHKCANLASTSKEYLSIAKTLVKSGADIQEYVEDTVNPFGSTDIFTRFIEYGDLELIKLFLRAGVADNFPCWSCFNALQVATVHGLTDIAEFLLKAGANVNGDPDFDQLNAFDSEDIAEAHLTPLQLAISHDQFEMIEILLEHGADVNGLDMRASLDADRDPDLYHMLQDEGIWPRVKRSEWNSSRTSTFKGSLAAEIGLSEINLRDSRLASSPVQAAAASGNIALVRRLLRLGANVNAVGGFGTALQVAAATPGAVRIVKMLLRKGADVNERAHLPFGRTALQAAIESGDTEVVEILLHAGADVNAAPCGMYGRSALQAAIEKDDVPLTVRLILSGARFPMEEATYISSGITCGAEQISVASWLLKNNFNINGITLSRFCARRAFEAASNDNSLDALQSLLDRGSDVNVIGELLLKRGLFCSDEARSLDVLQLLLKYKWDTTSSEDGISPMAEAIKKKSLKSLQLLIEAGTNVNALVTVSPGREKTTLALAAEIGNIQVCQMLITSKANFQGDLGTEALLSAIWHGNSEVSGLLLSSGVCPNWKERYVCKSHRSLITEALTTRQFFEDLEIEAEESLCDIAVDVDSIFDNETLKKKEYTINLLLEHGAVPDENFSDLLRLENFSLSLLRRLFREGLGYRSRSSSRVDILLLYAASREGNMLLVQRTVERMCYLSTLELSNTLGRALQLAVRYQKRYLVEWLLSKGADVNAPAARRLNALQLAIRSGSMSMFTLLLMSGADVNNRDTEPRSNTTLETAAENGRLAMVQMLLARDTEDFTLHDRCERASKLAFQQGFTTVGELLKRHAISSAPIEDDDTPLLTNLCNYLQGIGVDTSSLEPGLSNTYHLA